MWLGRQSSLVKTAEKNFSSETHISLDKTHLEVYTPWLVAAQGWEEEGQGIGSGAIIQVERSGNGLDKLRAQPFFMQGQKYVPHDNIPP